MYNGIMRVHSEEKIKRLRYLRRKGYSINEICEELEMPKTTVWHHVQSITVPPKYAEILRTKQGGGLKRTKQNWETARNHAAKLLGGKNRELSIVAAMLYWAEGNSNACDFVNSDSEMIKIYLIFLRRILRIPEDSLQLTIRLIDSMDKEECLMHWSSVAKTPKENIRVYINDGGSKSRTKYGMCRVVVGKGGADTLKLIHSLINLYSNEILKNKVTHSRMPS